MDNGTQSYVAKKIDGAHLEGAAEELEATDVVHGQGGAPLVFVSEECKSHRLARLLISHQVHVDHLCEECFRALVKAKVQARERGVAVFEGKVERGGGQERN